MFDLGSQRWPLETPPVEGRVYPFGLYAPGGYMNRCTLCDLHFIGDKRALHCEPCEELFESLRLIGAMQDA